MATYLILTTALSRCPPQFTEQVEPLKVRRPAEGQRPGTTAIQVQTSPRACFLAASAGQSDLGAARKGRRANCEPLLEAFLLSLSGWFDSFSLLTPPVALLVQKHVIQLSFRVSWLCRDRSRLNAKFLGEHLQSMAVLQDAGVKGRLL